jgi:hypothetical protein
VLEYLASLPRNTYAEALKIAESCGLDADRLNDAVSLLDDDGLTESNAMMGTDPFDFGDVMITARGRRSVSE